MTDFLLRVLLVALRLVQVACASYLIGRALVWPFERALLLGLAAWLLLPPERTK